MASLLAIDGCLFPPNPYPHSTRQGWPPSSLSLPPLTPDLVSQLPPPHPFPPPLTPDLVSELLLSASDLNPDMQRVCSELMGLKVALTRINQHKLHSMEDMHTYLVGVDEGGGAVHGAGRGAQVVCCWGGRGSARGR